MATKNELVLAALEDNGLDPRLAYLDLADYVGRSPLIFTRNPGGGSQRVARALGTMVDPTDRGSDPTGARKLHPDRTQHEMCLRMCYAVANDRKKGGPAPSRPEPKDSEPEAPSPKPEAPKPPKATPAPKDSFERIVDEYLKAVAKLRTFVKARNNFDPLDSYRLEEDGIKLLAEGLPIAGVLCSITASWSADSRDQFTGQTGISLEFDYQAWGRANGAPENLPGESEYLYRTLKAGVFAYCHGPSQIGKSYGLKYAAERLELDYRETCVPGAMPSAIKGKFVGPDHYVDSAAKLSYRGGGLFNIDEIDFGEPDVLGSINNAVTNGVWHCDVTGDTIMRHSNFRLAATANTLGQGTDKRFQRNVIDGATQERFRLGRIQFKHDPQIARKIAADQIAAAKIRIAAAA